jgi:hypothetical protein
MKMCSTLGFLRHSFLFRYLAGQMRYIWCFNWLYIRRSCSCIISDAGSGTILSRNTSRDGTWYSILLGRKNGVFGTRAYRTASIWTGSLIFSGSNNWPVRPPYWTDKNTFLFIWIGISAWNDSRFAWTKDEQDTRQCDRSIGCDSWHFARRST